MTFIQPFKNYIFKRVLYFQFQLKFLYKTFFSMTSVHAFVDSVHVSFISGYKTHRHYKYWSQICSIFILENIHISRLELSWVKIIWIKQCNWIPSIWRWYFSAQKFSYIFWLVSTPNPFMAATIGCSWSLFYLSHKKLFSNKKTASADRVILSKFLSPRVSKQYTMPTFNNNFKKGGNFYFHIFFAKKC